MRILVTGATGVIGQRVVKLLIAAGHTVTGVARTEPKAALLRDMGADPVEVDLFDPSAVRGAVAGHEAVVNLATKIPPPTQAARTSAWSETERIRREASRHLVDAALEAGAGRFVQESICFIYADRGHAWIDEDVPLDPPPLGRANEAAEAQARRFTEAGGTGVVLRFGQFYAWDSTHTRYMRRMARLRLPAIPGPKDAYASAIAADDAATAVVAALGAPAGTWNVTDDRPLTRGEFHRTLTETLGVRPPVTTGSLPLRLSRNLGFYLRSQRVSNRRFKQATGWSPRLTDAGAGWRAMVAEHPNGQGR
ncbi:NAD-dependent epimerase/dehydratase family protein [Actinoallomurus iriomotensis]|uniref:Nucleoside-diphosphate sugar epimerase n=1 Tax=Actinoallomurus iriomotensis TaxID=478107 RepID=A0A9W6VXR4_9ACTN|nr:NAD(P)-dependent oxidoreductase [Actinoallomurus iriomotensis]GLY83529.1 nucleoside-diphosphate sugar epimerase [Actinoallomurus iriomotensis]